MNVKRFMSYLLYVVAFGYFVIKADDFKRLLRQAYATTYDSTYTFLFMSIFPIIVGLLLALPQYFETYQKRGVWKRDWIVLLAVGLPTLLVTITPMLINLGFDGQVIAFIVGFHPTLVTVAGILFGFVLFSSLSKQEIE